MNILKNILGWGNNESLKNIITKKAKGGELFQHHIPFMMSLVTNNNSLKFYKTDETNRNYWIDIINRQFKKTPCINRNSIIIVNDNIIDVILFRWSGLYNVVDLFSNRIDNDKTKRNLFLVRYDIEKYLSSLSDNFETLIRTFSTIVIKNDNIEMYKKIVPDKALLKKGKLVSIPVSKRIPITKITIFSDPSACVTSVRLKEKHPNADLDGWFCLGKLKRLPLNVDTIYKLMELIKCYKLDDCYWRPGSYKEW